MTHRINPAGEPITDDDATIAAALAEASVPCLMMSMIHMTGDASLLDGDIRPVLDPRALYTPCLDWLGVDAELVLGRRYEGLAVLR